jgi:hypothetical protein
MTSAMLQLLVAELVLDLLKHSRFNVWRSICTEGRYSFCKCRCGLYVCVL